MICKLYTGDPQTAYKLGIIANHDYFFQLQEIILWLRIYNGWVWENFNLLGKDKWEIKAKNIATKCICGGRFLSCFAFKDRGEKIKRVRKKYTKLMQKVISVLNKNVILYNIFRSLKMKI